MLIGIPKEIKNHEYRVGVTPDGVRALVAAGHQVRVEAGAGTKIGFADELYRNAGAQIAAGAREAYAADMVIKVKELQSAEFALTASGADPVLLSPFRAGPGAARRHARAQGRAASPTKP